MPNYAYTALSADGRTSGGVEAAVSESELRDALQARGLFVRSVKRQGDGLAFLARRSVRREEIAVFVQEIAALLRAGLPLVQALEHCVDRPDSPRLAAVLQRVLTEVRGGSSLSAACAGFPEAFERLFVAALASAEKTGRMAEVLAQYHKQLSRQLAMRDRMRRALAYPAFLVVLLLVILAALFIFVMPRFREMYASLGATLPMPTQALIWLSSQLAWIGPLLFAAVALAVMTGRKLLRREPVRLRLHQWIERLPYIGAAWTQLCIVQYTSAISSQLEGGAALVDALWTARSTVGNASYASRADLAAREVTGGQSLAASFQKHGLLPATGARLVAVGEASGQLASMLAEVARYYEERVDSRMQQLAAIIEPLAMLVTGLVVGAVIIIMYLPVFRLAEAIG